MALRLWLGAVLLMMASYVQAAEPIGSVVVVKGEAVAENAQGQSRVLKRRMTLYLHDTLKTKLDSRLQFRLADGTLLTLGENTTFRLSAYHYQANDPQNNALFTLTKGVFRSVTGLITQDKFQKFEVQTPVATLGVRGTDFWGGFLFSAGLDVLLIEGHEVYVKNSQGETLLKQAGLGTTVMPNAAPQQGKTWASDKVQQAQSSVAF